jgi:CubicO group peptidase (beta-lactamase class C family)
MARLGLLRLAGKLALTDDVRTRFPELHLTVPVTIDNLIHHTSGLRDYAERNQLPGAEATGNQRVIDLLTRQKSLNFAPGSSLAPLAHDNIFAPLKMQSTRYAGSVSEDPPGLANSYLPSAAAGSGAPG